MPRGRPSLDSLGMPRGRPSLDSLGMPRGTPPPESAALRGRTPPDSAALATGGKPAPGPAAPARPRRQWTFKGLFVHLGSIGTEASYSTSSNYSRLTGTPDFFYLTGLKSDPGVASDGTGRMNAQFGNQSSRTTDWRSAAHTRITLPFEAGINTNIEFSSRRSNSNDVINRSTSFLYPDFDVDFGKLSTAIGLDRVMRDPRLHTGYTRTTQREYNNGSDPISITVSSQWQPMLGLEGSFKNGTRAIFKLERRVSQREDLQLGSSTTTDRNTDVNFSLNRTYTSGQKVNFLGKESTVRSTVNLGLSAVYSRRSGETRREGEKRPLLPRLEDRLSVNTTGSYGFSNNMTGNLALGFGQTRNLQRGTTQRNVRVELRASFTF
jgi:hypothetical protein